MRRRHRRAVELFEPAAGNRRIDGRTGREQVQVGRHVGKPRDLVVVGRRADADRGRDACGHGDAVCQGAVARSSDRRDPDRFEIVDRGREQRGFGIAGAVVSVSAEAHIHGRDVVLVAELVDVLETRHDIALVGPGTWRFFDPVIALRRRMKDLNCDQIGAGCDAGKLRPRAERDTCNVRAVPAGVRCECAVHRGARAGLRGLTIRTVAAGAGLGGREARFRDQARRNERMRPVDAGIEDRDDGSGPVEADRMRSVRLDERDAFGQRGGQ